eukprot:4411509-Pyramimonas_sp.AAC.1
MPPRDCQRDQSMPSRDSHQHHDQSMQRATVSYIDLTMGMEEILEETERQQQQTNMKYQTAGEGAKDLAPADGSPML